MTTRDIEIAHNALACIEGAIDGLEEAWLKGDDKRIEFFHLALYLSHGLPFGKKDTAVKIWYRFRQATTSN